MFTDPSGHVIITILSWIAIAIAVGLTVNDVYEISKVSINPIDDTDDGTLKVLSSDDSVKINNSDKIITPWARFGFSFYLNHICSYTKNVIKGTTGGVAAEWELHNYASWLGIGGDIVKDVDVGSTIFADGKHHPLRDSENQISWSGVMSIGMRAYYIVFGNPINWIIDLAINGGF